MDSSTNPNRLAALHDDIPFSRPSSPGAQSTPHKLGFCGIGSMGYFMARNLATHRNSRPEGAPPLLIYNRTRSKAEKLLEELGPSKIRIADGPEQIARECDIIITNMANDTAVKSIYARFKEALSDFPHGSPKIFVETSTVYPTILAELDNMLSELPHTHLITCPVFGRPSVADKAGLILVMSGDYRSKKEVAYLLVPAMGRKIIDLGGNIEKAPTLKLIGNSIILGCMEVMSESLTLGEKTGVGAPAVLNLIKDLIPAPIVIGYANKMTHDIFDGKEGFAIEGGLKDAAHMRNLAADNNAVMPTIDVAYRHLITARAIHEAQRAQGTSEYEIIDWSALVAGPRVASGLDGFNSEKHIRVEKEE